MNPVSSGENPPRFLWCSLFALVISTPLIFLKFIDSSFDLAKKSSLLIFGGVFLTLCIIYLFLKVYRKNDEQGLFIDKKIDPVVLFFFISALLSTIFSVIPYNSFHGQYLRQIGFVTYFFLTAIYFFTSYILRTDSVTNINRLLKVMELTAAVAGFFAVLQYLRMDPFDTPLFAGTRPVSSMGHSTFTGGFLILMLPFSLVRIFRDDKPYTGIILSLIIFSGILVAQSRAAYAGAIILAAAILILFPFVYKGAVPKRFKQILKINLCIIFFAGALITAIILLFPQNPFAAKLIRISDLPNSARWVLWRDCFEAFKLHPVVGSGIATFGSVFEFFTSYELKAIEPKNIFDHAHNVYLNTLVTMGTIGLLAYFSMLLQAFYCSVKAFFNKLADTSGRLFFLGVFASMLGYSIYSLAAFENTAILLYFFVILAMLKVMYSNYYIAAEVKLGIKAKNTLLYACIIPFIGLGLYCIYNFYPIYNDITADSHYKAGKEFYMQGDIKNSINELNQAVTINSGNADYKYTLAYFVQDYVLKNPSLSSESKTNLLIQAEQELERAKQNFFLHLQYKSLKAMIKLQLGDSAAFTKLKKEVYEHDTLVVNFRLNLARYNFIHGKIPEMMNDLNSVLSIDPYSSDAIIMLASYYASINNKQKAVEVCDKYLQKYSLDPYVISLKNKILSSP